MFVFSLEDEISFQTVYNYFLRLCSFRSASEVPMVLVGTQGEQAFGLGPRWAGVRKPSPPLPRVGWAPPPGSISPDLPQLRSAILGMIGSMYFEMK